EGWAWLSAGIGSKGPRGYDWRRLEASAPPQRGWQRWVLLRRIAAPTEVTAYMVYAPATTGLAGGPSKQVSKPPRARSGWITMKCAGGRGGLITSPWPCGRKRFWRSCGLKQVRTWPPKRGADADDHQFGPF